MAGIIANGDITFDSVTTGDDNPIMLTAPLISSGSIYLNRDLGHDGNAVMPAQSVASYNKFLYLLSVLEKNKSEETLYYTGLTSYDLDWEYIY